MIIQQINFKNSNTVRAGISVPNHNYNTHIHEFSEIIYVLEGSIESTVDGKSDVLNAGDLAVITPFKPHSTFTPTFCRVLICVISNDFLLDMIPRSELFYGYKSSAFKPSAELKAYLDKYFVHASIEAYTNKTEKSFRTTKACIHAIIDEFTATAEKCTQSKNQAVLSKVIIYMNENFKNPITIKSVAKELGYVPGHISHCLYPIAGMSFPDLLNSIRIEHGKKLLLSTSMSNIEIAYECGYSNERSFYRAFRSITGTTPSKYKRREINVN